MTYIQFSPNSILKSADINANFSNVPTLNFATTGVTGPTVTTSASYVDVTGVTLTINPTKTVTVHVVVGGRIFVITDTVTLNLLIDGVSVHTVALGCTTNVSPGYCLNGQATLAAGARIIKVQAKVAGGQTSTITDNNMSLFYS